MYEGNYEKLANAIILQAVKDFRPAYRRLRRHPNGYGQGDYTVLLFGLLLCPDRSGWPGAAAADHERH